MIATIDRGQVPTKVSPTDSKSNGASKKPHGNYSKSEVNNQQYSFSELHFLMRGKWAGYHASVGIIQHQIGKQCACQGCGGTDRFSFQRDYADTGRWFCRQGGDPTGGDGFSLLGHVFGWTPAQQLQSVAEYLGLTKADDKERGAIRRKAEAQTKAIQAAIKRKDEQARTDSNLIAVMYELIDTIKHRQYLQRQAIRFKGDLIAEVSTEEVQLAQEANNAILEAYAHQKGVDYV